MKGYDKLTVGQIKDIVYKCHCPAEFGFQTEYSQRMVSTECEGNCDACWASEVIESS